MKAGGAKATTTGALLKTTATEHGLKTIACSNVLNSLVAVATKEVKKVGKAKYRTEQFSATLDRLVLAETGHRDVSKVVAEGSLQPSEEDSRVASSDGGQRRYVVLVLDDFTHRILTTMCPTHELLAEGVCTMELIHSERPSLPILDAIYFMTPTEENIKRLVEDACYEGEKKRSKYRRFHVFFTHKVSDDLMSLLGCHQDAVMRIHSFAEANMGFMPHDQRSFHFADSSVFSAIVDGTDGQHVSLVDSAERLATVFASVGVLDPRIVVESSNTDDVTLASQLAADVRSRLSEIANKGPLFEQADKPEGKHTLVVLNRSYDWPVLLMHDFHYEALAYDLLGGEHLDIGRCMFKQSPDKEVALGDEADELWKLFCHMPLWDVNDMLVQENSKFAAQDREMTNRTSAATNCSNMASMATNAMNALQTLPQHKKRGAMLNVHTDIRLLLGRMLEGQKLIDVGMFQQEILTGIDHNSRDCMPRYLEKQMESFLGDPDVPYPVKMRLLMLFCAAESSIDEAERSEDKIKAFARRLPGENRKIATFPTWLSACRRTPETSEAAARRRSFYKEKAKASHLDPTAAKLTRWQPKIRDIMEQAARNDLPANLFQDLDEQGQSSKPAKKDKTKAAPSGAPKKPPEPGLVVVFVVGGFTLTEARQAHEVSQALGTNILVGGNCLLTTDILVNEIKNSLGDPEAEGADADDSALASSANDDRSVAEMAKDQFKGIKAQLRDAKDSAAQSLLMGSIGL